ncbi:MAG: hypothetical protein K8R35_01450 [Bacteroidales bacterium]|nr:hypothetical protein [Bacteroidales bacterium]
MNNIKRVLIIIFIAAFSLNNTSKSCTVFFASDGIRTLAATNKDWNNLNTRIRVMPSSEGKFGRIYFGYNIPEGFQNAGGVNEYGLWYDGASLPNRSDISNYYNKPEYKGELCEKALEECKTVDEVIALYSDYYSPHWQGHSMWGDKYGNSVIIEFGEKDVVFIKRDGIYQLMTNFYILDTLNTRWFNCQRFKTANAMFEGVHEISVDHFTDVLNAVHQNGFTPTLYSNIYDLSNGVIYIYNYHRYTEVVRINMDRLLGLGDQNISIPDLFHEIETLEPVNNKIVSFKQVSLSWSGEPCTYSVWYSDEPGFNNYTIQNESLSVRQIKNPSYLILIIPLFLITIRKKRLKELQLVGIFVILSTIAINGCSKIIMNPYPDSEKRHEVILSDLQPGTKYYWKVISSNPNELNSESTVQTFITNN